MRPEDRTPYTLTFALTFGGMMIGYHAPLVAAILTLCLFLVLIAALRGKADSTTTDLSARPIAALGHWLAQKDNFRWVRLAPFIGLMAGWLFQRLVNVLAAQGAA